MKFLEKDLEEIIFNANKDSLCERGLLIKGKLKRQVRIGNYGIADLIEHRRSWATHHFTVYELKQETISLSAFLQAVRYAKGIKHYLSIHRPKSNSYVNLVLIGRKIDMSGDLIYLPDIVGSFDFDIKLITYEYDVNGIMFKEHCGYRLNNPGF